MSANSDEAPVIVVGYDGSSTARLAVDYAAARAGRQGKVYIVHAYEPPPDWQGWPDYQRVLDDHLTRGRATVDELLREDDPLHDTNYEIELMGDQPAEAIINVADARGADEIAVGTRGLGIVRTAVLGSISHEVIARAKVPVVVVPPAAAEAG